MNGGPMFDKVSSNVAELDGGTKSRAAMNDAAIAKYTEPIPQRVTLPPMVM